MRFADDWFPGEGKRNAAAVVGEGRFYADPTVAVPIVYGRTRLPGILIEQTNTAWGGTAQKAVFLLIGEGPIDSVVAYRLDGVAHVDEVTGGKKVVGIFYRDGAVGVNDTETEAEYTASPTTQLRSQNVDYRSKTATTYSETAYVIFLSAATAETDFNPQLEFDVKGLEVQAYNADGTANGSPAYSVNPIWQATDFLRSAKHGLGVAGEEFDAAVALDSANFAAAAINSTEASTTVTTAQAVASTTCIVGSTTGFVKGRNLLVNGVANTVADVVSEIQLTLGTAVIQSIGHTVVQRPARFESHYAAIREADAKQILETILGTCRGFITYDAGKIQLRIERATVVDPFATSGYDGSFELWTSPTNLTNWSETTTGGTVNQESTVVDSGTYAVRLDRTGTGQLEIYRGSAGYGFIPGAWYRATVRTRGSVASAARVEIMIYNQTRAKYWRPNTGDWGAHVVTDYRDIGTAYATEALSFQIDPSFAVGDAYTVYLEDRGSTGAIGTSVYFDGLSLRGPYAGDFRDLGFQFANGILEDSFDWEFEDEAKEVNQVRAQFVNLSADQGRDEVEANDQADQIRNGVRSMRYELAAVCDRDQAYRLAKWKLDKLRTLGPGAKFDVGLAGLAVQPGDIVLVTHAIPGWAAKECRVTEKEIGGLGDSDELCVTLRVEGYDETIYTDGSLAAFDAFSRGAPTIAVSIDSSVAGQAQLSWAWTGDGYAVTRYLIYASTTTGFAPSATSKIGSSTSSRFVYAVPKAWWNVPLYFRVRAQTDRGTYDAPEVSSTILAVDSTFTDPTQSENSSPFNHVWDGDFSEQPTGWETQPQSGETVIPASSQTTEPGYTAFTTTGNAYTSNNVRDQGAYSMTAPGGPGNYEYQGIRYSGFGSGTGVTGYIRVEGFVQGKGTCTVEYSPDSGTNWYSAGVTIPDSPTDVVVNGTTLSGLNRANLRVRVLRTGPPTGTVDKSGLVDVDLVALVVPTLTTPYSLVESGAAKLVSDGTNYAYVRRQWPGQSPAPGAVILPANAEIVGRFRVKHDGSAATANVQLVLKDEVGSIEWILVDVAAGDVTANWQEFAAKISVGSNPLAGDLYIYARSKSTAAVRVDKVGDMFGSVLFDWSPHPGEMQSGVVGDFSAGRATGFTKGLWVTGAASYKKSPVA